MPLIKNLKKIEAKCWAIQPTDSPLNIAILTKTRAARVRQIAIKKRETEKCEKIVGKSYDVDENKGRLSATRGRSYDVDENMVVKDCIRVEPTMLLINKMVSGLSGRCLKLKTQESALYEFGPCLTQRSREAIRSCDEACGRRNQGRF